ncbi:MAG: DUF1615 domain-containing protein [Candidatus Didemnitutus sp.]|nr:DUF1615 domain-containing protein [Candidatus Didemnitutus sp.]
MNTQRIPRLVPVLSVLAAVLGGCAAVPPPPAVQAPAPVEIRTADPLPSAPAPLGTVPAAPTDGRFVPGFPPRVQEQDARRFVYALLPPGVTRERDVWAADIVAAFTALRLAPSAENFCASIAVIEQESSFQADPVVPGLSRIVWREIETRRKRYLIPKMALDAALSQPSRDGKTYRQRINALKTERQMSILYGDIIDEVPGGKLLLSGYNPVRTGGPMQVSVAFAETHAREKPYAGATNGKVREAVFTRRGGVYFGIAHLLDYPAPYRSPLYRFADFNAGHYASRNAAFQLALGKLAGQALVPDGDLLRYEDGRPSAAASSTQRAALKISRRLRLNEVEIEAGLRQEKEESFGRTKLYQRVFALADEAAGRTVPHEAMPQIRLKSPKITSKITTGWFAERVDMRYRSCMNRAAAVPDLQLPLEANGSRRL